MGLLSLRAASLSKAFSKRFSGRFSRRIRHARRTTKRSFLLESLEQRNLLASVPFAADDPLYATAMNTDLVISTAGTGVVNNDSDVDSSSLSASVVANPAHGTIISFNSNGTFTYRPNSSYVGPDSFTYKVNNGTYDSNVATVNLQVGQVFGPRTNQDEIALGGTNFDGGNRVVQDLTLGQSLIYNSNTEPRPVVVVETSLLSGASVPTSIEAVLTFNGVAGSTVTYSTSGLTAGSPLRFVLQADGSGLATGYYDYTMTITAKYTGSSDVVQTFTGSQAVVNRNASEYGRGWWYAGLDELVPSGSGVLWVKSNGDALWFKNNSGTYAHAKGDAEYNEISMSGSNYVLTSKNGMVRMFSSAGELLTVVDPNSNTYSYTHTSGKLTTVTEPFGRTFTISYSSGYAQTITDYASHASTLSISSGKLNSVTLPDPDGGGALAAPVHSYSYDGTTSLLTQWTDALSNDTAYSYNSTSKRLSEITHEDSSTWQLTPVQTIGLKTGSGNSLVAPSSAQGQITDEEGYLWKFRTDRYGNAVEFTDRWNATSYTYRNQDGIAYKSTSADPDGAGSLTAPTTKYGYDAKGNVLKTLNPDLTYQTFTYNSLSRPLTATDEVGRVTTMTYNSYGNVLTKQDNAGNTWTYTYTSLGLVNTETSPDPDGAGSLTAYVADYDYDSYGRVTTITLPNSATKTFTYNASDEVLTSTNELGKTTTNTYDSLDRLLTVTLPDPDGAGSLTAPVTTYAYNAMGLVSSVTDPLSNITSITYNNRNWKSIVTYPDPDGAGSLSAPTDTFTYMSTGEVETSISSTDNPSDAVTYSVAAITSFGNTVGYKYTWTGPNPAAEHSVSYDLMGRVTSQKDNGLTTTFVYDSMSQIVEIHKNPSGDNYTTTITYNQAGQTTSVTDANDHTTSYYYTTAGWLNSEVKPDPDGSGPNFAPTTTYGYDALGRVTAITNGIGEITNYEYNFRGQTTKITEPDPDGAGSLAAPIIQAGYDSAGQKTTETDPLSHVTTTAYDYVGRKTSVTFPDPDGAGSLTSPVESYVYDASSRLTSTTDARGGVTSYAYDNLGRTTSITKPDPDGAGSLTSAVTTYVYGSRGLSVVTDPLGHTITYTYDAYGNTDTITDDQGNVVDIDYDAYRRITSMGLPDPDGGGPLPPAEPAYQYDVYGRVLVKIDSLDGQTSYTYDGVGNITSLTDPEGNTTSWSYDALDRITMETNELGKSRSFIYDAMNNLVRRTDRNARVTQYVFDDINRTTAEKWYSGTTQTPSISIATTQDGVATNEVQKVGYERTSGFGSMSGTFTLSFGGYTTSAITAGASAATIQSALEGLTSIGSGNVSVTKTSDTSLKQEWQITFQGSLAGANHSQVDTDITNITAFPFTPTEIETTTTQGSGAPNEVQTVALSNATGGTFRLAYKGQTTAPLAYNASSSTVDSALEALSTLGSGTVSVSLTGSTYTITFDGGSLAHTNVNSLQGDISTATYGTVDRTISWTYNAASEITQITDPSATIDYTLDNLGRATSIVNTIAGLTPTVTFDQVFNAANDRTQLKAKISTTNDFKTDFTYDTLGRVTDIVQQSNSGNTVASKHITLAYNKLAQLTTLNRYESTGTSNQVASTDFTYDSLNHLTDIDHKQGSTVLASYDYVYDDAGRISSVTSSQDGLTSYTHDNNSQVTAADFTGQTDETYTFDGNGNRIGGSYTVNANNLTSTDGTYSYIYDDEGNRTKRTTISSGAYEEYTWDYRNRLTKVTFKNSSNVVQKTVEYVYDADNRLIRRTYDADGPGAGAAVDQFWAYDEGINALIEFDAATAADVSHRYVWGPQADQFFADEQVTSTGSAGNVLWGLRDNSGTIRDIADLSGSTTSVTNHRRFGTFGNLVSESNSSVDLVFTYTGKFYDEVTAMQNNLNRWYDPKLGQWISEDPISFLGGDASLRRYVGNSAIDSVDADGLQKTGTQTRPHTRFGGRPGSDYTVPEGPILIITYPGAELPDTEFFRKMKKPLIVYVDDPNDIGEIVGALDPISDGSLVAIIVIPRPPRRPPPPFEDPPFPYYPPDDYEEGPAIGDKLKPGAPLILWGAVGPGDNWHDMGPIADRIGRPVVGFPMGPPDASGPWAPGIEVPPLEPTPTPAPAPTPGRPGRLPAPVGPLVPPAAGPIRRPEFELSPYPTYPYNPYGPNPGGWAWPPPPGYPGTTPPPRYPYPYRVPPYYKGGTERPPGGSGT